MLVWAYFIIIFFYIIPLPYSMYVVDNTLFSLYVCLCVFLWSKSTKKKKGKFDTAG